MQERKSLTPQNRLLYIHTGIDNLKGHFNPSTLKSKNFKKKLFSKFGNRLIFNKKKTLSTIQKVGGQNV